jgi:hypothetical protein
MVVKCSENESLRKFVIDFIDNLTLDNNQIPLKILDVGGGINSWLGERVTHIIDNQKVDSTKEIFLGDINEPDVWRNFHDNEFDFVSCTHTLEDIRNPGFVVNQMSRIGRSGFIATPSRFIENSFIESHFWKGYSHHRWMFRLSENNIIEAMCKFPSLSARNGIRSLFRRAQIGNLDLFLKKYLRKFYYPHSRTFKDLDSKKSEFGVVWKNEIEFTYFNDDFAGISTEMIFKNYQLFMSDSKNFKLNS